MTASSTLTDNPAATVYTTGFLPDDRDYVLRCTLGRSGRGGSEVGEVLELLGSVPTDDRRAWFDAWVALGTRINLIADCSATAGHRVSAARAHLRAASYFAVAVDSVDGLPGDRSELVPTFHLHRAAWQGFMENTAWAVDPVAIPYQDTTLPGWFFRPDGSGTARPTLIVVNGSDGAISGLWCDAAEGALERGYNVLLFDGPGQQSMLFDRGVPFRYDWEAVLTPVVDFLLTRGDVDPARIAGYAISQGGYWLPRALAFEHRLVAAVADGGVVDVSRSWTAALPPPVLHFYLSGDRTTFNQAVDIGFAGPGGSEARRTWDFRARPYGNADPADYAAVLDEVRRYDLTEVAARITTPLYITAPADEQFWPGQSAELARLTPGAVLAPFTAAEGARLHCQPLARGLTEQRMFDWLDEILAATV